MKTPQQHHSYLDELIRVMRFASSDSGAFKAFLEALLTPKELTELSKRWQVAKLLQENVPHHEIARKLHMGVATITRGSKAMKEKESGFRKVLRMLQNTSNI